MDAIEAIMTRRSTRDFKPVPVEPEKLRQVIEAGRYAPSGGNNQTCRFLVVRSPEVIEKLVKMVETAFAAMETEEGMYRSLRHSIERSKRGGYVFCYNAPVLVIVANVRDYGNNMADCAAAIENMLVAANALDLGSCYINQLKWLNEDPTILAYLGELGLAGNERVYGAVALGYPNTESGLPDREPLKRKGNFVAYI